MAASRTQPKRKAFDIKDIERGDIVYISIDDTTPYLIIDVGNPFCLVENLDTHFGYLYHCTTLFKDM